MEIFNLEQMDLSVLEKMKEAELEEKAAKYENRFGNRFGNNQPFLKRHEGNRKLSGSISYFFNLVSLIGLLYAVQELLRIIPIPYLNWVIAIILLTGFEILKRKYSDLFWDYYWMSKKQIHYVYGFINFVLLFGISLGGSLFGMYFVTTDHAPEAKELGLNDDPEAVALQEELVEIDEKMAYHNANKNSAGEILWPSQQTLAILEEQRLNAKEILRTKYGIVSIKNQDILSEWKIRKDFRAGAAILLCFIFEILFEICMRFNSKYDYLLWRCWEENKKGKQAKKKGILMTTS